MTTKISGEKIRQLGTRPNDRQVGGEHYQRPGMQHWDLMVVLRAPYLVGCLTKYVERHPQKGGEQDLEKAIHYAEKRREEVDILTHTSALRNCDVTDSWRILADYAEAAGLSPLQTLIFQKALLEYTEADRLVELCRHYRAVAYPSREQQRTEARLGDDLANELEKMTVDTDPSEQVAEQ